MESTYNQLTQSERYQIEAFCAMNQSARKIGQNLSRSNTTISRELATYQAAFKGQLYDAKKAQALADGKRNGAKKFTKCSASNQALIDKCLTLKFSPEQIAGRLKLEGAPLPPSRSSVYRWVHGLGWRERLPRKGKPRR